MEEDREKKGRWMKKGCKERMLGIHASYSKRWDYFDFIHINLL